MILDVQSLGQILGGMKNWVLKAFILELNTQPGMTPTSLVPEQANFIGSHSKIQIG